MNFLAIVVYLIIAEVISSFSIASYPVKIRTTVSINTCSCCFVVSEAKLLQRSRERRYSLITVNIWGIVERLVSALNWSSSPLILEMPVEAGKRAMLCALMLQEKRTLVHSGKCQSKKNNSICNYRKFFKYPRWLGFSFFVICEKQSSEPAWSVSFFVGMRFDASGFILLPLFWWSLSSMGKL